MDLDSLRVATCNLASIAVARDGLTRDLLCSQFVRPFSSGLRVEVSGFKWYHLRLYFLDVDQLRSGIEALAASLRMNSHLKRHLSTLIWCAQ